MLFFLSNNGMRVLEVVKVRRKDIRFYERKLGDETQPFQRVGALVQVHKSTKTAFPLLRAADPSVGDVFPHLTLRFQSKRPFQNENLITDDKVKRETWEAHEWSSFARLT